MAMGESWSDTENLRQLHPEIRIKIYQNMLGMLKAVAFGDADATIGNMPAANYLIASEMLTNIVPTGFAVLTDEKGESLFWGVQKGNVILKSILDKAMAAVLPEQVLQLKHKWFGESTGSSIGERVALIEQERKSDAKGSARLRLTCEEQDFLDEHPVIRVHNEMDWPPFNYNVDGKAQGLTIDIMNRLAEIAGFKVEYIHGYTWDVLENMLREKKLDVMGNIMPTPSREEYIQFSDGYIDVFQGVAVKRGDEEFMNLDALKGQTVAVVRGFFHVGVLREHYPEINLLQLSSSENCLLAVSQGRAQATIGALPIMDYLIRERFIAGLSSAAIESNPTFRYASLAFGVRKDWPELCSILSKSLEAMGPGELSAIKNKWLQSAEPSRKINFTRREMIYLQDRGPLRFCADPDFMPFEEITDDGELSGMVSDYLQLVSDRIGVSFTLVRTESWSETLQKAKDHECDLISLGAVNSQREEYLNFTVPYLKTPIVIATRQDEFFVESVGALSGKKVGMVGDYPFAPGFKTEYPDVLFMDVENIVDGLNKLHKGEIDAYIDSANAIGYYMRKEHIYDLKISGQLKSTWDMGMGVRKDDPVLLSILDKALASISEKERQAIENKWIKIHVERGVNMGKIKKWAIGIGSGVALLFFVFTLWNRRLQKEIDKRRETEKNLRESQTATSILYQVASTVTRSGDLYETLAAIHDILLEHMNVPNFFVGLWDEDKRSLHFPIYVDQFDDLEGHIFENLDLNDPYVFSCRVIAQRKPVFLRQADIASLDSKFALPKVWLGAPLMVDDRVIGLMAVQEYDTPDMKRNNAVKDFDALSKLAPVLVQGEGAPSSISEKDADLFVAVSDSVAAVIKRKMMEEALASAREELRMLFENLPVGIFQSHIDGRLLSANPKMADLFGYDSPEHLLSEVTDMGGQLYVNSEDRQYVLKILKEYGFIDGYELAGKRYDGSQFWCSLSARFHFNEDGELSAIDGFAVDITERKTMHEALIFEKERAEEATRAKSDFLARMSHEIRTPMNAILGMSELLAETELNFDQLDYVQTLHSSSEILLSIINDILDFSKIEAGQVELESEPFDLIDLVESIGLILGVRAREKGLELAYRVSPEVNRYVLGDVTRLKQILINLVGNSIKFTDKGQVEFYIDPGPDAEAPELLLVTVRDTGIGIPKDQQENIFDSFTQADTSTTRKFGGTGLGLAISKRLVSLLGGDIWIESESGNGATFYFTVRLEYTDVVPASGTFSESFLRNRLDGVSVLVVDDNATNRLLLLDHLTRWGAVVNLAESGEAALEAVEIHRERPYQVIFMDMLMSGLSGMETAKQIKEIWPEPPPHIIVNTSRDVYEDRIKAREIELDGFLPKPVKRDDLRQLLSRILGQNDVGQSVVASVMTEMLPPLKLLLVEDIPTNRKVVHQYLKNSEVQITDAENGQVAVDLYMESGGGFDLIFMDREMPVMDGMTATGEIRKYGMDRTPIVALTAHAFGKHKEESLAAGCDDFIAKPVKKKELLQIILRHTSGSDLSERKETLSDEPDFMKFESPMAPEVIQIDADMEDLVPEFLEELDEAMDDMSMALEKADYEDLRRLAHGYKGAAANCGMNELSAKFKELEDYARNKDAGLAQKKLGEVRSYLASLSIEYVKM
ncbi:response regulator [Marinifilum sp. JC120]|nr:response regulator [Marinifilum sp. JC120]